MYDSSSIKIFDITANPPVLLETIPQSLFLTDDFCLNGSILAAAGAVPSGSAYAGGSPWWMSRTPRLLW